jgi:hexosaminidase
MIPPLIPQPRKVRYGQPLELSGRRWLIAPGATPRLRDYLRELARSSWKLLGPVELWTGSERPVEAGLLEVAIEPQGQPAQGYRLAAAADGWKLTAADEAGAFYGLQTLHQLLRLCGNSPPELEVEDWPDFPVRGVMLDISRCKVPTMATLRTLIDRFAELKFNQVQLYTEHTFAFAAHRTVWAEASPLSGDEVRELDAYCRARYIELVPNLNSFGHFERWLRHPAYRHLAESPDGFVHPANGNQVPWGSTLKPNAESLAFIEGLFAEMLPNFSSQLFNVGCDETWELGTGWSKEACAARGKTRVYLDFLKEIHAAAARHGRRIQFWGDIILKQPDLISELPKDAVALEWGYEADHPFARDCQLFADAGINFYVCPGTSSWNSLIGRSANCLANLASAAEHGRKAGASGYLITDWGDGGHHQTLPVSWLGFGAGAAFAWCLESNRDLDLAPGLGSVFLQDASSPLPALAVELGRAHECLPGHRPNRSAFNDLLFWRGTTVDGLDRKNLREALARLEALDQKLEAVSANTPEAERSRRELRHGLQLARLGAARGLLALGEGDAERLREAILESITTHEELWLERNRPGGLAESSAKLREAALSIG